MATTDERIRILKMVEDGRISAEEAAKLLSALAQSAREARPASSAPGDSRFLRIRVTDAPTGQPKVNIRLPVAMVNLALKYRRAHLIRR